MVTYMRIFMMGLIVGAPMCLLAGCATPPYDELTEFRDPYERTNRNVHEFNMTLDDFIVEPAARGYRQLPDQGQVMLTNFTQWTSLPSTTVNSSMQGDMENAALGTFEFLINGLTLGLVDLTDDVDTPRSTNFDDTLEYYQAGHGSYIVLPLIGPGTVRSHTGWVVDSLTNPFRFASTPAAANISAVNTPVRIVTFRGNNFEYINDIKYQSLDSYARIRSIYLQYDHADKNHANEDKEDVFDSFIETTE